MKKLKLTAFQLGSTEILTRQQLRNVLGGDLGGSTTTTTTKLMSTPKNCAMYSCYVGGTNFACVDDTRIGHTGDCFCSAGNFGCSTSHP